MADPQPAQSQRAIFVHGVEDKGNPPAIRIQLFDGNEQVHVIGALCLDPEVQFHGSSELDIVGTVIVKHPAAFRCQRVVAEFSGNPWGSIAQGAISSIEEQWPMRGAGQGPFGFGAPCAAIG